MTRPTLAYVLDPRFPGGTSAAVAAELAVTTRLARTSVHGLSGGMFKGQTAAPVLADRLDDLGLRLSWDSPVIGADMILLHNPSFLRLEQQIATRMICRDLVVITHENFLRPGDVPGFDVAHCLDLIARASLSTRRWLAPVSPYNRAGVERWLSITGNPDGWKLLPWDWFNICEFAPPDPMAQARAPRDRRGRLSRPGPEKFPSLDDLDLCFPPHASANVILGADRLMDGGFAQPHWQLHRFGTLPVADFFDRIDFMVYFTAPTWRESFGRVLAEAVGAGKVVLTDPATAQPFGAGVIACTPSEVDAIIAHLVAQPDLYAQQVRRGQERLTSFSGAEFARWFTDFQRPRQEHAA
ncbi:MAG TPA: hypothetical protein PK450_03345 [Paracoccaceae bacterium]|nr:hypothetical protein [Paracoccaceae bacterium]